MLPGFSGYAERRNLSICQRCSMGLRSGHCAGQSKTLIPLSLNHPCARFEVCLESLSCYKVSFPLSISQYCTHLLEDYVLPIHPIKLHSPEKIITQDLLIWGCIHSPFYPAHEAHPMDC